MEGYTSEQEQVDAIRRWWGAHGKSILLGLTLGLAGLAGYRYWDESRNHVAESASITYEKFLGLSADKKGIDEARKLGLSILENYENSTYAPLTALLLARLEMDHDQPEAARKQLQWVVDHGHGKEIVTVAKARLAQLTLADGKADAAWKLMEEAGLAKTDRYAELRADILVALGRKDEAIALYEKAQKTVTEAGGNPAVIELKLERLGHSSQPAGA